MKSIFVVICCFFTVFQSNHRLRELKIGDEIRVIEGLNIQNFKGHKILVFIKSDQMKSIAFFKKLIENLEDNESLKLYLIDLNSTFDRRILSIYENLKIKKELITDEKSKIYGRLGIIVLPTLLSVTKENRLHSIIPGYRDNLDMFFQTYINALLQEKQPRDVFAIVDEQIKKKRINRLLKQAFLLMVNENFDLAQKTYQRAVELESQNREALLGIGYSLLFQKQFEKSLNHFADLKQRTESKRVLLGYYLCEAIKEPTDVALKNISTLSLIEPRFFMIIFEAATLLDKAGKYLESKELFRHGYEVLLRHFRRNK